MDILRNNLLQVVTPSGNILVDDLTLRLESGSNLLITGNALKYLLPLSGSVLLIISMLAVKEIELIVEYSNVLQEQENSCKNNLVFPIL